MSEDPRTLLERLLGSWATRLDADPVGTDVVIVAGSTFGTLDATAVATAMIPDLMRATAAFARLAADPPRRGMLRSQRGETVTVELQPGRYGPLSNVRIEGPTHHDRSILRVDRIEHRDAEGEAVVLLRDAFFETDSDAGRFAFARDLADFVRRIAEHVAAGMPLLGHDDARTVADAAAASLRRRSIPTKREEHRLLLPAPWAEATHLRGDVPVGLGSPRETDHPLVGHGPVLVLDLDPDTRHGDAARGATAVLSRLVGTSPAPASLRPDDAPADPMAMLRLAAAEAAFADATRIAWYDR